MYEVGRLVSSALAIIRQGGGKVRIYGLRLVLRTGQLKLLKIRRGRGLLPVNTILK